MEPPPFLCAWRQENLGVMSIGFMLPNPDDAVIWRGPRKNGGRRGRLARAAGRGLGGCLASAGSSGAAPLLPHLWRPLRGLKPSCRSPPLQLLQFHPQPPTHPNPSPPFTPCQA